MDYMKGVVERVRGAKTAQEAETLYRVGIRYTGMSDKTRRRLEAAYKAAMRRTGKEGK